MQYHMRNIKSLASFHVYMYMYVNMANLVGPFKTKSTYSKTVKACAKSVIRCLFYFFSKLFAQSVSS